MNRVPIKYVSHKRDKGVIKDETLKPHRHCVKSVKSADSIMADLKALFQTIKGLFTHPKPGDCG